MRHYRGCLKVCSSLVVSLCYFVSYVRLGFKSPLGRILFKDFCCVCHTVEVRYTEYSHLTVLVNRSGAVFPTVRRAHTRKLGAHINIPSKNIFSTYFIHVIPSTDEPGKRNLSTHRL